MIYLLDTDHMSLLERGGAEGAAIRARLDGRLRVPITCAQARTAGKIGNSADVPSSGRGSKASPGLKLSLPFACAAGSPIGHLG